MRVGLCLLCRSRWGQRGPLGDGVCRDTLSGGLRPRPGVGLWCLEELSAEVERRTQTDWIDAGAGLSGQLEILLPTHPMAINNK